jgi:integrase
MQLDKYEKRAANRISDSTLSVRLSALRKLENFVGGGEPDHDDVVEWADHLIDKHNDEEIKASTIREYMKCVDYYFEVVHGETGVVDDIKAYLPRRDTDPGEYLTMDEWDELLESTDALQDRLIIYLMYKYARRPSEIRFLNREDIDLENEEITFFILKKTDQNLPMVRIGPEEGAWEEEFRMFRATFDMVGETEKLLSRYMKYTDSDPVIIDSDATGSRFDGGVEMHPLFPGRNGHMSYANVWSKIKKAVENAGIQKNVTPKGMRHSRATHLDWQGNNPEEIARHQLLHAPDSNQIGSYIHEKDEDQTREVMTLDDE